MNFYRTSKGGGCRFYSHKYGPQLLRCWTVHFHELLYVVQGPPLSFLNVFFPLVRLLVAQTGSSDLGSSDRSLKGGFNAFWGPSIFINDEVSAIHLAILHVPFIFSFSWYPHVFLRPSIFIWIISYVLYHIVEPVYNFGFVHDPEIKINEQNHLWNIIRASCIVF